jgi:hypothetical protein
MPPDDKSFHIPWGLRYCDEILPELKDSMGWIPLQARSGNNWNIDSKAPRAQKETSCSKERKNLGNALLKYDCNGVSTVNSFYRLFRIVFNSLPHFLFDFVKTLCILPRFNRNSDPSSTGVLNKPGSNYDEIFIKKNS